MPTNEEVRAISDSSSVIHSNGQERRVAIFVDNENLYLSLKQLGVPFVDYASLQSYASQFGRVDLARVYTSKADPTVEGCVRTAGFDIRYVPTNGYKRTNVDSQMLVDMMCHNADTYVVVTGDLDFEPAVRRLREQGKKVVVLFPKESASAVLLAACNEYHDYRDLQPPSTSENKHGRSILGPTGQIAREPGALAHADVGRN